MKIKCIRAFGNFLPGDVVEVPADNTFDTYFFEAFAADEKAPKNNDGGDK